MKLIIAYIQPHKLNDVKQELYKAEVFKISVTDAIGCGQEMGYHESYRGVDIEVNLLKKVRIDIAVNEDFVQKTIDAVIKGARTGRIGDGKIFITDLVECIRIRTGEKGRPAIGCAGSGGRAARPRSAAPPPPAEPVRDSAVAASRRKGKKEHEDDEAVDEFAVGGRGGLAAGGGRPGGRGRGGTGGIRDRGFRLGLRIPRGDAERRRRPPAVLRGLGAAGPDGRRVGEL